jgi:hypothetical protein
MLLKKLKQRAGFGYGAIVSNGNKNKRIREGLENWCGLGFDHSFEKILENESTRARKAFDKLAL